ncbi:MAG: GGDEF domain-containing protein [Lachnospiraceae bacterium]|nr:GGDEF domain-containing protein [Lachnospiraceae bacterium]
MDDKNIYNFIAESSADGFRYVNYETGQVLCTPKLRLMFGFLEDEEISEEDIFSRIYEEDKSKYINKILKSEKNKDTEYSVSYRILDGNQWVLHKVNVRYNEEGEIAEKCVFFQDVTELRQKQIELEYMAFFDGKTGLFNRNHFIKRLNHAIEKIPDENNKVQVLYMDIDNFNMINDSIGFEMADEVIVHFSGILNSYATHEVKIGRFNNDEFVMALFNAKTDDAAFDIYEDLVKKLEQPIILSDNSEVYISISVGIAFYSEGMDANELVKCADIAMFNVKQRGKNGMKVFSGDMLNSFNKNVQMEHQLKNGVIENTFFLNYQPQYEANGKELRGFEALIRWKPDDVVISPVDFIPVAEKTGYIVSIGNWVIDKAFEDFAEWKNRYNYNGVISINISAVQLRDKDFVDNVVSGMKKYNLEPSDIEIEITESVFMEDYEDAIEVLKKLKANGYKISLDDFGTGYSSLSYLKDMPIDTLKIDKSFVDTILTDESTGIITDSVVAMVKKLGLETIAEGVETEEQYEYLKKINCDNIQGYLLGKPMDREQIIELLEVANK